MEVPGRATVGGNFEGHVETTVRFINADLAEKTLFPRMEPAKAVDAMQETH